MWPLPNWVGFNHFFTVNFPKDCLRNIGQRENSQTNTEGKQVPPPHPLTHTHTHTHGEYCLHTFATFNTNLLTHTHTHTNTHTHSHTPANTHTHTRTMCTTFILLPHLTQISSNTHT